MVRIVSSAHKNLRILSTTPVQTRMSLPLVSFLPPSPLQLLAPPAPPLLSHYVVRTFVKQLSC